MIAAADEIGIGKQALDRRQALEELEHRSRVEEVEQLACGSIALLGKDLPLVEAGVPHLEHVIGGERLAREVFERESSHRLREEPVDDDVRKGLGETVGLSELLAGSVCRCSVQGKPVAVLIERMGFMSPCGNILASGYFSECWVGRSHSAGLRTTAADRPPETCGMPPCNSRAHRGASLAASGKVLQAPSGRQFSRLSVRRSP